MMQKDLALLLLTNDRALVETTEQFRVADTGLVLDPLLVASPGEKPDTDLIAHANVAILQLTDSAAASWETLGRVRAWLGALPLLVLLPPALSTQGATALARGADDYLLPDDLTPATVTRAVRYALERGRLQQEVAAARDQARRQIDRALAKSHLFAEARRQLEELAVLHEVANVGAAAEEESALLEEVTRILGETLYPDNFGVMLLDRREGVLYTHPSYRAGDGLVYKDPVPLGQGICGRVALTGRPRRLDDVRDDASYIELDPAARSELCVPLKSGDKILGVVNAESRRLAAFTEADEQFLLTFANQVATAISRLRLVGAERRRLQEAETVRQAAAALSATLDLDQVVDLILIHLEKVIPFDSAEVFLLVNGGVKLVASGGTRAGVQATGGTLPAMLSLFDLLRERRQPLVIEDVRAHLAFEHWSNADFIRGWMGVPLILEGDVIGCITLNSGRVAAYGEPEAALAQTFANQASIAIKNAGRFDDARSRAHELGALVEISARVRMAGETAQIRELVLDAALDLFDARQGAIAVPGSSDQALRLAHSRNWPQAHDANSLSLEKSLFGHVFTSGEPYLAASVQKDPRLPGPARTGRDAGKAVQGAAMYVPLLAGKKVKGILALKHPQAGSYDLQDLRLLTALAEIAGSALHRAGLMETLELRVAERTRELAEANKRLQELDRLKSKFVSDISHELRTPITNLSLYMDLIERSKGERSERYWAVLRKQAERLKRLIEDILDLSRLELGRAQGDFAALNLNRLMAELLEDYTAEVEAAGITLDFRPQPALPPVWGRREQLLAIGRNLLENSLSFTPAGEIVVTTGRAGEWITLTIADSGMGIPAEDMPHIFERFYRGQHAGQSNIPGTGLGLAIVKEAVNLHGGEMGIQSTEGEGTTIRVLLPRAQPAG